MKNLTTNPFTNLKKLNELKASFNENFQMVVASSKRNPDYKEIGILDNGCGELTIFSESCTTTYTRGEIEECFIIENLSSL